MAYVPRHPLVTVTIYRRSVAETPDRRRDESWTEIGTVTGGYEDLADKGIRVTLSGEQVTLHGRLFCDAAQDIPAKRSDVGKFTDPSTSEPRSLRLADRRGPFRLSAVDDHVEYDFADRQAVST